MLHDEYVRLAKSVDYISEDQAKQIIMPVLDKLKEEVGAIIVDVWVRISGKGNVDILRNYIRRSDPGVPGTQDIALHKEATGLLAYAAETKNSVWLDDLRPGVKSALNRRSSSGDVIEGRYLDFYDKTRSFAAVPIQYRDQQRAILTLESAAQNGIQRLHMDLLESLHEPTGILVWKGSVFEENKKQTDQAIDAFRASSSKISQTLNPYRTGFIARPFDDRFERVCKAIEREFRNQRIQATTYKNKHGNFLVPNEILTQISSAHFCMADVTGLNNNVMVELGSILASGKPFILIKDLSEKDNPLPFNVGSYECRYCRFDGDELLLYEAASSDSLSLQEFVRWFVNGPLKTNKEFQDAREWTGGDSPF